MGRRGGGGGVTAQRTAWLTEPCGDSSPDGHLPGAASELAAGFPQRARFEGRRLVQSH